jgi:hypothetical protein
MARLYKHIPTPTPERLWELFELNPLTGRLHWRVQLSARTKVGQPAGCVSTNNYIVVRVDKVLYGAHRLVRAWIDGADPGEAYIDHWDRNTQNNSPWNLRLCTQSQNMANVPTTGWTVDRNGKYVAQTKYKGVGYHIGTYNTPIEAYTAYSVAKRLLFGEYALIAQKNLTDHFPTLE